MSNDSDGFVNVGQTKTPGVLWENFAIIHRWGFELVKLIVILLM